MKRLAAIVLLLASCGVTIENPFEEKDTLGDSIEEELVIGYWLAILSRCRYTPITVGVTYTSSSNWYDCYTTSTSGPVVIQVTTSGSATALISSDTAGLTGSITADDPSMAIGVAVAELRFSVRNYSGSGYSLLVN